MGGGLCRVGGGGARARGGGDRGACTARRGGGVRQPRGARRRGGHARRLRRRRPRCVVAGGHRASWRVAHGRAARRHVPAGAAAGASPARTACTCTRITNTLHACTNIRHAHGMHTACTLHVRHWLALLPCALLSCGCALGGVGWVFGCGREGGVALQPTTLLLPLLLLPLLLDGAFVLLAATEAAWKAGQDDAQVRRLAGALERVSSPLSASLLASLAGCALAPLAGVYDADGAAAMAVSGPALQLAVGLAVGLLS
eukprot:scaffold4751_cov56-Phaeocystis_antarctica.AAC.1